MADGPIAAYAELLARVELFSGLDRVTLAKLAAHLQPIGVPEGDVVMYQGDPADAFCLVARGAFGVYVSTDDGSTNARIATLAPGAPFGEMGLLTGELRSATVRADGVAEVLRPARDRFLQLVQREPAVALAIAARISRRLRIANIGAPGVRGAAAVEPSESAAAVRHAPPPARATVWTRAATGLAIAAVVLLVVWLTPPPPGLAPRGWRALGTLVAVVPALALDALPEGVLALALAAVWVVGSIAPAGAALSGFASSSWGPAVPNATSRVALIAPAAVELVDALGYEHLSREATGLAMGTLIGFGQMAAVFLTSSTTAVLVFAVLPPEIRGTVDRIGWAVRAAPANAVLFAVLVTVIAWRYRPRAPRSPAADRRVALALQRALLGPPSRSERVALAVAALLSLGCVTQSVHGVDPAWVAVLAVAALAAAGIVTADSFRAVN